MIKVNIYNSINTNGDNKIANAINGANNIILIAINFNLVNKLENSSNNILTLLIVNCNF